jgi:hypothetical protein
MPFIHWFSLYLLLSLPLFLNFLSLPLPPPLSLSSSPLLSISPFLSPLHSLSLLSLPSSSLHPSFCDTYITSLLLHTHPPSVAALSAYQRYQQLSPLESSTNTSVTYGLGLIYFNMNSYKWWVGLSPNICSQVYSASLLLLTLHTAS